MAGTCRSLCRLCGLLPGRVTRCARDFSSCVRLQAFLFTGGAMTHLLRRFPATKDHLPSKLRSTGSAAAGPRLSAVLLGKARLKQKWTFFMCVIVAFVSEKRVFFALVFE